MVVVLFLVAFVVVVVVAFPFAVAALLEHGAVAVSFGGVAESAALFVVVRRGDSTRVGIDETASTSLLEVHPMVCGNFVCVYIYICLYIFMCVPVFIRMDMRMYVFVVAVVKFCIL